MKVHISLFYIYIPVFQEQIPKKHFQPACRHVLSREEENIIAQFGEITPAAGDVFKMLNDADMKFGTVTDEDGEEVELTHGNYIKFLESHDRSVRKEAYEGCYKAYRALINTLAAAYNYSVKGDCLHARMGIRRKGRMCTYFGSEFCCRGI